MKSIEEQKKEFKKVRTDAISVMFEKVADSGIYPTTAFFEKLDAWVETNLQTAEARGVENTRRELLSFVESIEPQSEQEMAVLGCIAGKLQADTLEDITQNKDV